ncbi:MAG: DUF4173 domain-containing protein [Hungatella sp.]|nr:DUF4173 domain-containing protein [Hungatella sp.]
MESDMFNSSVPLQPEASDEPPARPATDDKETGFTDGSAREPAGPPFYQHPPGFSPKQQARAENRTRLLKPMEEAFPFFGGISLLFGVLSAFCLYKNPCGVTYPLFVAFACLTGVMVCQMLEVPMKKDSWVLLAFALLTGISVCRTADRFLITLSGIALVLTGCIFALHQFYDDRSWNIGKYLSSIFLYLCRALGALPVPFRHTRNYLKNQDNRFVKQLPLFFGGFLAALPLLAVVMALLGQADAIFSDLTARIFNGILRPSVLFGVIFRVVFAALSLYCLVCSCLLHHIAEETAAGKKAGAATVIAGLSMIGLIYVIFSLIQIVYLFLGRGTLPDGYTYSSYARQGFFQLLLVAFLNLVMVLCCLKYIRPHPAVKFLLTLICICTYILIASASFRMMLYIREYHLSYLRLLVLWFLAMTAVLMAGVTWLIHNPAFPLFRFGLAVVMAFYLALAFSRPDAVIGRDYVNHLQGDTFSAGDFYYLYSLSADAAPALKYMTDRYAPDNTLSLEEIRFRLESYGSVKICPEHQKLNFRTYNDSCAKAKKLFPGP